MLTRNAKRLRCEPHAAEGGDAWKAERSCEAQSNTRNFNAIEFGHPAMTGDCRHRPRQSASGHNFSGLQWLARVARQLVHKKPLSLHRSAQYILRATVCNEAVVASEPNGKVRKRVPPLCSIA